MKKDKGFEKMEKNFNDFGNFKSAYVTFEQPIAAKFAK